MGGVSIAMNAAFTGGAPDVYSSGLETGNEERNSWGRTSEDFVANQSR